MNFPQPGRGQPIRGGAVRGGPVRGSPVPIRGTPPPTQEPFGFSGFADDPIPAQTPPNRGGNFQVPGRGINPQVRPIQNPQNGPVPVNQNVQPVRGGAVPRGRGTAPTLNRPSEGLPRSTPSNFSLDNLDGLDIPTPDFDAIEKELACLSSLQMEDFSPEPASKPKPNPQPISQPQQTPQQLPQNRPTPNPQPVQPQPVSQPQQQTFQRRPPAQQTGQQPNNQPPVQPQPVSQPQPQPVPRVAQPLQEEAPLSAEEARRKRLDELRKKREQAQTQDTPTQVVVSPPEVQTPVPVPTPAVQPVITPTLQPVSTPTLQPVTPTLQPVTSPITASFPTPTSPRLQPIKAVVLKPLSPRPVPGAAPTLQPITTPTLQPISTPTLPVNTPTPQPQVASFQPPAQVQVSENLTEAEKQKFLRAMTSENLQELESLSVPKLKQAITTPIEGLPPLAYSFIKHKTPGITESLLTKNLGMNFSWKNNEKKDYLYLATSRCWTKVVNLLLQQPFQWGADLTVGKNTALHIAISSNAEYTQIRQSLLKQNIFPINHPGDDNMTFLHLAASAKDHDLVQELLSIHKATVDPRNIRNETPLHLACRVFAHLVIKILITNGADGYASSTTTSTPIYELLCSNTNGDGIGLIGSTSTQINFNQACYKKKTPLQVAAAKGIVGAIKTLLLYGALVDTQNVDGNTALHSAAKHGQLMFSQQLVQNNAKVSVQNKKGQTPLMLAVQSESLDLVKFLIEKGSDVTLVINDETLINSIPLKMSELCRQVSDGIPSSTLKFLPRDPPWVVPKVLHASLEQLIVRATYERYADKQLTEEILLTYRCFASAAQIFVQIVNRWNIGPPPTVQTSEDYIKWKANTGSPIRLRIIAFLRSWLEEFPSDFVEYPALCDKMQMLLPFIEQFHAASGQLIQNRIAELKATTPIPRPVCIQGPQTQKLGLLSYSVEDICSTITELFSRCHTQISLSEVAKDYWTSGNFNEYEKDAPHLIAFLNLSKRTKFWILTEILQQQDAPRRAQMMQSVIRMGQIFLDSRNYEGVSIIGSVLGNPRLTRLQKSWSLVKPEFITMFKTKFQASLNSKHGSLTTLQTDAECPKILHLGVILKELTTILKQPSFELVENENLISWAKHRKMAFFVKIIASSQKPYNFQENLEFRSFLLSFPAITDENVLSHMSNTLEPGK